MGLFQTLLQKKESPMPEQPAKQVDPEADRLNRWMESRRTENPAQKLRLLEELAKEHYPAAMFDLGLLYVFGEGVEEDWERARELFLQCYEEIPDAALHLGMMGFRKNRYKVQRDNQIGEGIYFLSEAAMRGVDEAFPEINRWWHALDDYEENWIAEAFQKELEAVCASLEEQGDAWAYDALGQFYQNGVYYEQDLSRAKECFERAVALDPDGSCMKARQHLENPIFSLLDEDLE